MFASFSVWFNSKNYFYLTCFYEQIKQTKNKNKKNNENKTKQKKQWSDEGVCEFYLPIKFVILTQTTTTKC